MELQFDLDFSELEEEFKKLDEIKNSIEEFKTDKKSDALATAMTGYAGKINDILGVIVKEITKKTISVNGIGEVVQAVKNVDKSVRSMRLSGQAPVDITGLIGKLDKINFSKTEELLGKAVKLLAFSAKSNSISIDNFSDMNQEMGTATSIKQDEIKTILNNLVGFQIPIHNYIALTYVAAGNGEGEVETVTYKAGGSGGTTVAVLTVVYNASDEISSVTKTTP